VAAASLTSSVEGVGDLDGGVEKKVQLERAAGNAFAERLALEKLHGDEGAMCVLTDFVDGANVGMVEGGSAAGFALKTLEGLAIVGEGFGKKLQSDMAAKAEVFGFVDFAHATGAELAENAVVRDGFAKQDAPALARILCARMKRVNEVAIAGSRVKERTRGALKTPTCRLAPRLPRRLSFCAVSLFKPQFSSIAPLTFHGIGAPSS
jgi:hypothetical protein